VQTTYVPPNRRRDGIAIGECRRWFGGHYCTAIVIDSLIFVNYLFKCTFMTMTALTSGRGTLGPVPNVPKCITTVVLAARHAVLLSHFNIRASLMTTVCLYRHLPHSDVCYSLSNNDALLSRCDSLCGPNTSKTWPI